MQGQDVEHLILTIYIGIKFKKLISSFQAVPNDLHSLIQCAVLKHFFLVKRTIAFKNKNKYSTKTLTKYSLFLYDILPRNIKIAYFIQIFKKKPPLQVTRNK
jgi:hypothetical protein